MVNAETLPEINALFVSIFIRNRNAFLVLFAAVAALKLILSALAPASLDLKQIVELFASGYAPIGPWVALYPPLYNQTAAHVNMLLLSWTSSASLGSNPALTELSLLFRLPVFLFDIATMVVLFLIGRKMKSPVDGRLMGLIWFLNPLSFFGVELLGLPDVVCVFLIALSFLLLITERPFLSAAALGLGAFVKLFPIFLLPPLLIYMHLQGATRRSLLSAAAVGVIGFSGYFAWVLQHGFQFLATSTPVTQLIPFIGGIPNTVNPVAFGMFAYYCLMFIFIKKTAPLPLFLSTLLVYYLLAMPGPQYLIWLLPLIAVELIFDDRLGVIIGLTMQALVFVQWFLASSAFVTPSGYSLLMFSLGLGASSYAIAIANFLDSDLVSIIILPVVSSAAFALILAYAVEQIRPWFHLPQTK